MSFDLDKINHPKVKFGKTVLGSKRNIVALAHPKCAAASAMNLEK